MDGFNDKRLADPVHGTIGLSRLEVDIIDTQVFQRLRNIKQLGLTDYVYPSANYSRFSHSIGACHIAGKVIESLINRNFLNKKDFSYKNIQRYRLAALLHDIGHYPFSHPMELAIKEFYQPDIKSDLTKKPYLTHENIGKEIVQYHPEIREILNNYGYSRKPISRLFTRERPDILLNIM